MITYPHLETALRVPSAFLQLHAHMGRVAAFFGVPEDSPILREGGSVSEVLAALEARLIELKRAAGSPEFCTADAPGLVTPDEPLAPEPAQPIAAPELPAGGRFHRLRDGRKVLLVTSPDNPEWRCTFVREGFDKTLTRSDAQEDLPRSVFEELDALAKAGGAK